MKFVLKCKAMKFNNGCLLVPATPSDKYQMNTVCETVGNGIANVTVSYSKSLKSYDQCKTVFALINLYFYIRKNRYPTEQEQALTYSRLLWQYAPKTEDPLNPDNLIPISLSNMNKTQASIFINGIMAEVYEYKNGLTDFQEIELKELFEDFNAHNGYGNYNPIDYDDNGNLMSESEWRIKNHFSFASGIEDDTLQLHHIISRSARKDLIDMAWNWIMLTDFEHNRIYHDKGWEYFLETYPHCAGRIKNAFDKAHQLYPLDLQNALKKMNMLDDLKDDDYSIPETEGLF